MVVVFALLASACQGGEGGASREQVTPTTVQTSGTTQTGTPTSTTDPGFEIFADSGGIVQIAGASVKFDPGDLRRDTMISVGRIDTPSDPFDSRSLVATGPALFFHLDGPEPVAPVQISIVIPDDVPAEGETALLGQLLPSGQWEFVDASFDPATRNVSGEVPHSDWWNPFVWCWSCFADDLSQEIGKLLVDRTDPPSCSGEAPAWLRDFVTEDGASGAFTGCVESDGSTAVVKVVNNRPYGVIVESPARFAWSTLDHTVPWNDIVREIVGPFAIAGADWMYIPPATGALIGIPQPDAGFVELTVRPNTLTVVTDALRLTLEQVSGKLTEEIRAAMAVRLGLTCLGTTALLEE